MKRFFWIRRLFGQHNCILRHNVKSPLSLNVFKLFLIACIFCFTFLTPVIYAQSFTVSEYDFVLAVQPECSEYLGYVRFEIPQDVLDKPNIYSAAPLYISKSRTQSSASQGWYVVDTSLDVEKIMDGNTASAYIVFGEDLTTLRLKNSQTGVQAKIDSLSLFFRDTDVTSIVVRDKFGQVVSEISHTRQGFTQHLEFRESYTYDELFLDIYYSDKVFKLGELSAYARYEKPTTFGYLYIDNTCNQTQYIYFGSFGVRKYYVGEQQLPVLFPVNVELSANPLYNDDFDGDGIRNDLDNCVLVSNSDQKDINYNRIGDACEDFDGDGIFNSIDNCPDIYNYNQLDSDGDGLGDACDSTDNRVLEQNPWILYIVILGVIVVFIVLARQLLVEKK
jgi:hypothetical protein